MTVCLLVRHAVHDLVDRMLAGRMDGIALSRAGRQQAAALAGKLKVLKISCVQSSPRQRATETAAAIADCMGLRVDICSALDELDYGAWTGCPFDALAENPRWVRWNCERHRTRPPGGESMHDVQARIVSHLKRTHEERPHGVIVMVTHAEVIRAAVLHAMSMTANEWMRVEVPPASVTRLQLRACADGIDLATGTMIA